MQHFFRTVCFTVFAVSISVAQQGNPLSRGFLPPYFSMPAENEVVNFSSPLQPVMESPEYPFENFQSGKEGVVEVELYVTAEGKAVYSEVNVSSGDVTFDASALQCAMNSSFPPGYATVHGISSDFKIAIPFYFLLSADPERYWHSRLELARVQKDYELAMRDFQSFITARTIASKQTLASTKTKLEEKVRFAKRLHKMLAEKKETAILRLRDEISSVKMGTESAPLAIDGPNESLNWRRVSDDQKTATVTLVTPRSAVTTEVVKATNNLERLQVELEIKKSYL